MAKGDPKPLPEPLHNLCMDPEYIRLTLDGYRVVTALMISPDFFYEVELAKHGRRRAVYCRALLGDDGEWKLVEATWRHTFER